MTFQDGIQIDPSLESGGRQGGGGGIGPGMVLGGGGGILGLIVVVVAALFGGGDVLGQLTGSQSGSSGPQQPGSSSDFAHCTTAEAANRDVDCRIIATFQSTNIVWAEQIHALGKQTYVKPRLDIFKGSVNTRCGAADSAVGPFYCPADATAYFDSSFFELLTKRFGASSGGMAQSYVVAHEVGHHISNITGTIGAAQKDPAGPQSGAVRVELQADCYAGVWAHHASKTPQKGTGIPFLKPLTEQEIQDALSAAAAVGDDRIQKKAQGRTNPETYTHGTSEQRMRWFMNGYKSGDPVQCDTFKARQL